MSFTGRFTDRAAAYAASRPSYPLEAVDVLIDGLGPPAELVVADVGAGTGISSRLIASRGPHVLAIEPNAAMRETAGLDPGIEWIDGIAERMPLEPASVDVIAAFQAWHWVDHPAGVAEARRVLRPHGRIAVVYNERDERDPFTAGYGTIVRRYATDDTEGRRARALAAFATIDPARTQRFSFGNIHVLDRAGVHKRAESSSYLPRTGPAADKMHAEIDALVDAFERDGEIPMHLETLVVRVDS